MQALALLSVLWTTPFLGQANDDAQIVAEFTHRVADYVKIHKSAQTESRRLKPTASPEAIERYQVRLARGIRRARMGTRVGEIFTPAIAAEFRRLIAIAMQGPDSARIRQSLQRAAPVQTSAIRVNSRYPAGVALQSTPPSLLQNLPPLSPEVDYRVVGRDLVLRDVDANLVVDILKDAIP